MDSPKESEVASGPYEPVSPTETILRELSSTTFACTELTLLPTGTTNFVFRGNLQKPWTVRTTQDLNTREPATTVIIKHLEPFVRLAPDLKLDPLHGSFESFMLGVLEGFYWEQESQGPSPSEEFIPRLKENARTPHLLHVNPSNSTLVIEDFESDSVDWRKQLSQADSSQNQWVGVNGKTIGRWLRAYHRWTMEDSQQPLRDAMRGYEEMGRFRRWIHYAGIPKWTEENGLLDDETRIILKQVEQLLVNEFADTQSRRLTEEWGPIHGDFWTGNVLIPSTDGSSDNPSFSVIDWEFAHLGPRAFDLGHMIGDLIEQVQLGKAESFEYAIIDFIQGYGPIGRNMAFRALVHAGVQLMGWYVRGPKTGLREEQIRCIIRLARDMICFGMKKDEQWFRDHELGAIFDQ